MHNFKNKYFIVIIIIIVFLIAYIIKQKLYDKNIIENRYENNIKWADDITLLNRTRVERVIDVLSINDIFNAIDIAKKSGKKLIPRGTRHTMGGHTIAKNGLILDMKYFNHILEFDPQNMIITVEPGMTWSQLICYLDCYGLSPMTLQSYSSFSIGGTISVNAHGITNDSGIYGSIISLGIINWKNEIIECCRETNKELFSLIIGGYGLFGVIYKVKLKIVPNVKIRLQSINLKLFNFDKIYSKVLNDPFVEVKMARINITNMNDISLYIFKRVSDKRVRSNVQNKDHEMSKLSQLLYKWVLPIKTSQDMRFKIEKIINKPLDVLTTTLNRNTLLYESAKPIAKLYCPLIDVDVTHILQEFFIPKMNFLIWMQNLKQVFNHKYYYVTLLNITIRFIKKDNVTMLRYAKEDMYAFVLYYRLSRRKIAEDELKHIHNLLTNHALNLNGTFYLPYRHHYNNEQLIKSYQNIKKFFVLKKQYDPHELFSNIWYENYKGIIGDYQIEIFPNNFQNEKLYFVSTDIIKQPIFRTQTVNNINDKYNQSFYTKSIIYLPKISTIIIFHKYK
jgi:hypothetical protein